MVEHLESDNNNMSFVNKVILITGGSSGIGAAAAILFAKEGADVAIVGRDESKLNDVAAECARVGKAPLIIKANLSKDKDVEIIIEKTIDEYGKLDILINNAGVLKFATILGGNLLETYDELLATNLRPVVSITALAAPYLIKTKGNVINISSLPGTNRIGVKEYTPYGITKAGIKHFSRGAALELAASGVRVNTITPGAVKTELLQVAQSITNWNDFVRVSALKRVSDPEEIADMIMYLASDKAKGITGANFIVDNGTLIRK